MSISDHATDLILQDRDDHNESLECVVGFSLGLPIAVLKLLIAFAVVIAVIYEII